ncbi:hypothetical protein DACRYDRAFT_24680 [Dacryopinax primogenitus]|uniref:Uncharacterized protein n=1 Tax=Dacryopinax primogenitus (strain DJM 731) TaxID=1858805 RepID=M5FP42_DACPD|nr:uncharacterized protein DACRYDRAFT_24680 [Dacryopinax primogenitus]EJT98190.1 hypothetical protein DACRYDRAFT_24680 [Dacryopinax primogenitus]
MKSLKLHAKWEASDSSGPLSPLQDGILEGTVSWEETSDRGLALMPRVRLRKWKTGGGGGANLEDEAA